MPGFAPFPSRVEWHNTPAPFSPPQDRDSMIEAFCRLLFVAAFVGSASIAASADEAARDASFRDSLLPLLRTYCFDCHDVGSETPLGKDASVEEFLANRKTWVRASPRFASARCLPKTAKRWTPRRVNGWQV